VYNKNNKPFLKDGSRFLSISHSHKLTAIICSTNERVGIDLEYMSSNIGAFAFKFLNRKEKITKNAEDRKYHLYIHWCAKESLYKICDKEGISIRNNITVEPFEVKDAGEIKGKVHTDKINESFDLFYSRYDNYAIVWTKKEYGPK
jgi:phosphopantetheinyl transferase